MKLSYSIAILLSVTFVQSISGFSGPGATFEKPELMDVKRRSVALQEGAAFVKRSPVLGTALRRRQTSNSVMRRYNEEYFYPTAQGNGGPPAQTNGGPPAQSESGQDNSSHRPGPAVPAPTVQSTLTSISKSLTLILASGDDANNSDGGKEKEHEHGQEGKQDKDNRKQLIKFVDELGKAINKMLKEAGLPNTLDMKDTIKAAEKGQLYSPDTEKRDILGGVADQAKSSAPDQAKLQQAANRVNLATGQLQGFATQVEDDSAAAALALGPQVRVLISLVIGNI